MLLEGFSPAPLRLLPDSALLILGVKKTLVAADLHLGKSAAFRAHGLPVPEGDTARDLSRLAKLVREHSPDHLVIAGDLFHADSGCTAEIIAAFMDFTESISIPFTLVCGNHDKKIKGLPASLARAPHLDVSGIRIVHKPEDAAEAMPNRCGHIHPVVRIPDGKNTSLRIPCFHLGGNILTLPAFGGFTGGHIVKPSNGDRFFVSHLGKVIEVPGELLARNHQG